MAIIGGADGPTAIFIASPIDGFKLLGLAILLTLGVCYAVCRGRDGR